MNRPPIDQQVTFLYSWDLEKSARFYGQTLGLEMVLDQGACRIYRLGPDSFVGICAREVRAKEPNGVVLTIVTPDVDGWYDYLTAKGVIYEAPPRYSEEFKVYSSFLRDPNGYLLEIQEFRSPDWPKPRGR
ncbi:VOC family protein [Oceanibaculum nanhaiense]|uniref:VOC family protein n=1 Tax=Oceanibaculum nanhaiense TaxID=1909734 RepID=UPI003D29DEC8